MGYARLLQTLTAPVEHTRTDLLAFGGLCEEISDYVTAFSFKNELTIIYESYKGVKGYDLTL